MKKTLLLTAAIAAVAPLFVASGAAQAATTYAPELVYEFNNASDTNYAVSNIVAFGDKVAVVLDNGDVYFSDGTAAGTVDASSVLGIVPSYEIWNDRWTRDALDIDGTLYFFGLNASTSTWEVYKTDGVTATQVTDGLSARDTMYYLGGKIYVVGGGMLQQVDPSTGNITLVQGNADCGFYDGNTQVALANGHILFVYDNNSCDQELWSWDPSNPGNAAVRITASSGGLGANSSSTDYMWDTSDTFTVYNDEMYFMAEGNDGTNSIGFELFKTDGTQAGTVLVKDIDTNSSDSSYALSGGYVSPTVFNGELYFSAWDNSERQLWKTDGTNAGTVAAVSDVVLPGNYSESYAPELNGKLFLDFYSRTDDNGYEYYMTDGTNAGTTLLKDINPGTGDSACWSYCQQAVVFDGHVFFVAFDGTSNQVWTTDGTPEGTVQVSTFGNTGAVGSYSYNELVVAGNNLFFGVDNSMVTSGDGQIALYKISTVSTELPNTGADLRTVAFSALGAMALVAFGGALVIARRRNAQA